jgi:hypothetical protein
VLTINNGDELAGGGTGGSKSMMTSGTAIAAADPFEAFLDRGVDDDLIVSGTAAWGRSCWLPALACFVCLRRNLVVRAYPGEGRLSTYLCRSTQSSWGQLPVKFWTSSTARRQAGMSSIFDSQFPTACWSTGS